MVDADEVERMQARPGGVVDTLAAIDP